MTAACRTYHIEPLLRLLVKERGSDLHLRPETRPRIRISGVLIPVDMAPPTAQQCERWVLELMSDRVRETFLASNEVDFILVTSSGRFRINAYRARGQVGLVARVVEEGPASLAELGMPEVVAQLALAPRGLVLVTGPTGSGKTTTLAAMVEEINRNRAVHILTIEDPIEILHHDKQAIVTQRELHTDTEDYATALRTAMRQDPDVILIGEMRDTKTVRAALQAAETGHLVLSTLHTSNAADTINRIIDFYPADEHKQVRLSLAQSLRGVICQRLVPRADGTGRVCVLEILVVTPRVADAIIDPDKTATIPQLCAEGSYDGMQTFDQHLARLVGEGVITVDAARLASSNPHNLELQIKRAGISPALLHT